MNQTQATSASLDVMNLSTPEIYDPVIVHGGALGVRSEAFRLHGYGGPDALQRDEIAVPMYGEAQVLVHVMAAGVNGLDWKIRDGLLKEVRPLTFPVTLGLEFAGIVVGAGSRTSSSKVGDWVFAPMGGMGAYADFLAIDEAELSATPPGLSNVDAAALPVAVLTAWQALEVGGLQAGQTVLVHGAAGGVGGFVVQFAKAAGAMVIATASARDRNYVLGLGADQVIDYQAERFEDKASDVDLILDLVGGGEIINRSWSVLKVDGMIVGTPDPTLSLTGPGGRRAVGMQMHPDPIRLKEFAASVARGTLTSTIAEVTTRADLAGAVERTKTGHRPGKIVLDFTRAELVDRSAPARR